MTRRIVVLDVSGVAEDLGRAMLGSIKGEIMSIAVPEPATQRIPPLQAGDRLTRDEFERRYFAMPDIKKAELIEGVVYMPSPVCTDEHASPHFTFIGWMSVFQFATPGIQGGDNGTLRLDLDNEPQPDAFLRIRTEFGGQSKKVNGFVEGAPELVAEVSASSASYDLHTKLNVYRRNGVCEYIVWRVWDAAIDWFVLRSGQYDRLAPAKGGVLRSEVLPGLWLDPKALLDGDLARVLDVARQGIASREHAKFVKLMKSRTTTGN